jgi:putative acetyltransferase
MEKTVNLRDGRRVQIRPLQESDSEGLHGMYQSMSDDALRWSMAPYTEETIDRWIGNLPNLISLVAVHGGGIVGYASVQKFTHPRLAGTGDLNIYIHQDYQGAGLGTALMVMLLNVANEHSLHRINLEVVADNETAVYLFRKFGFNVEGRRVEAYKAMDGGLHDILLMGKTLNKDPGRD